MEPPPRDGPDTAERARQLLPLELLAARVAALKANDKRAAGVKAADIARKAEEEEVRSSRLAALEALVAAQSSRLAALEADLLGRVAALEQKSRLTSP